MLLSRAYKSYKKEQYKQGPAKTWTQSELKDYDNWRNDILSKQAADDPQVLRRQKGVLNGNKITTEIWNYGSISSPSNRITDIVWEGLGYGYEFGPFIGAKVEVTPRSHQDAYYEIDNGDTSWFAYVISDGLISYPEISPDGKEFWGWEPLAYNNSGVPYADPTSNYIPTSNDIDRDGDGKPDSWPEGWYNENLREYKWPGALKQGASNSDMESFFVVDDRENKEFDQDSPDSACYYPINGYFFENRRREEFSAVEKRNIEFHYTYLVLYGASCWNPCYSIHTSDINSLSKRQFRPRAIKACRLCADILLSMVRPVRNRNDRKESVLFS